MTSEYDPDSGLPLDKSYMECDLPPYLQESLDKMKICLDKLNRGEKYLDWDNDYCDLQSSINMAETEEEISSDQAWYLREKYLGLERR